MDLFTSVSLIEIEVLSEYDCRLKTDRYNLFKFLISKHENEYPDINKWFENKVVPGIINKSRIAYIGFDHSEPIATSILKLGNPSKFCHLHIIEPYRHSHLGELFFSMMALDASRRAQTIYFTLPESLWETENAFFKSFSFDTVHKFKKQYRSGDNELITSSTFDEVWKTVLDRLPKIISTHTDPRDSIFSGILLSIKPKYSDLIFQNKKIVEIRKKFNTKFIGSRVTLYSTHPRKELSGYAQIRTVVKGSPEEIWSKFSKYISSTQREFDNYTNDSSSVYAILLENVEKYRETIPLSQLNYWLDHDINVPQSYLDVSKNADWQKALSLSDLLQRRFLAFTKLI